MSILKIGSQGDETRQLQQKLKDNGYSIDVDGIFGSKTAGVVKQYQTANGLVADGIVGDNTWASLNNTNTTSDTSTQNIPEAATAGTNIDTTNNNGYQKSSDVVAAEQKAADKLSAWENNTYSSEWESNIKDAIDKITNMEDFSYDVSSDIMYNQYKDQYTQNGKLAMMDTMAENAALTGGYGSSYGQSVGQQTYNNYMQQLNNKIPELEQLALDRYNAERDKLIDNYNIYSNQDNTDYSRWFDADTKQGNAVGIYTDAANTAYANDYTQFVNDRDYNEGVREYQEQMAENKRQFDENLAWEKESTAQSLAASAAASAASSSSLKSVVDRLPNAVTTKLEELQDNSEELADYIDNLYQAGVIDENTVASLYVMYGGQDLGATETAKNTNYYDNKYDLNGDGSVTAADAKIIMDRAKGKGNSSIPDSSYDYDGNGYINDADALLLLNKITGK